MPSIEDKIPAFSMWKMFNDTIPALFSLEHCEDNVERLGNIIKSDEFSNIFVYSHNPSLTIEECESISGKYKSFTVWLLGRFFYLLSSEKMVRIHDTIVDAQLRILHLMSVTQPHVYQELAGEYCEALKILTSYLNDSSDVKFNLKVFVPVQHVELKGKLDLNPTFIEVTSKTICLNILRKTVRIIRKILIDNLQTHYLNHTLYHCLNDLIYITNECELAVKLDVLDAIFTATHRLTRDRHPSTFIECLDKFAVYLEQLVYEILNGKFEVNAKERNTLESALMKFNESSFYLEDNFRKVRICEFILNRHTRDVNFSKKLLEQCIVVVRNSVECTQNVEEVLTKVFSNNRVELLCLIERELRVKKNIGAPIELWRQVVAALKQSWRNTDCSSGCGLSTQLQLFEEVANMAVRLNLNSHFPDCLDEFAKSCSKHVAVCGRSVRGEDFLNSAVNCLFFCPPQKIEEIYQLPLIHLRIGPYANPRERTKDLRIFQSIYSGSGIYIPRLEALKCFRKCLNLLLYKKWGAISELNSDFLNCLGSIEKVCVTEETVSVIVEILVKCLPLFKSPDELVVIFFRILESQNGEIITHATSIIPYIICAGTSPYSIKIFWNETEKRLDSKFLCHQCNDLKTIEDRNTIIVHGPYNTPFADRSLKHKIVEKTYDLFALQNSEVRKNMVKVSLAYIRHVNFFEKYLVKTWMAFVSDSNKEVRKAFTAVIADVVRSVQFESNGQDRSKEEFLTDVYEPLKLHTKRSLQHHTKSDLQESIVETLSNLASIKSETSILHIMDLLLYFVMLPTSKHSLAAVNIFQTIESTYKTKLKVLYTQFRKVLCKTIVELAAINQEITKSTLHASLKRIGVLLGFSSTKDFVGQECEHLLKFLVPLTVKMPRVGGLISEMADMVEMELSQLLVSKYKGVFLHIYLTVPENVREPAIAYLERETGMSGPVLRKNNFRVILNELLLNFHVNHQRGLQLLKLLVQEDSQEMGTLQTIQDYLQPLLLGVLLNFDRKLERQSERESALRSLIELFRFIGAKNLSAMRFKIIAMLRTVSHMNDGDFQPWLYCEAWEVFLTQCDIEALGPQLATIFVSLLTLLDFFPHRVNSIFRYLIVENEHHLQENIRDLFFVSDTVIYPDITSVITKHTEPYRLQPFKDQLNTFVKYLKHETTDVRIHALKAIKDLMEKNREELDHMILGYNGIDPIVVTLIDALMSGCREKDKELRLMCGVVFGELGAIEPSHLPRRYAQQSKSFVFFISEDGFVVNVLTELIRALQAEVKTQNLDRYSLAIQEILKAYAVSPNESSPGCHIWQKFNEVQQELMRPMLSSKYMNVQSANFNFSTPIYGSNVGASFHSWIYDWTCSLVSMIHSDKKTLLHACLPSMKEERILMEFLPHILLHSLLEANVDEYGRIYLEMITVINSFTKKYKLDNENLEIRPLRPPNVIFSLQPVTPQEVKQKACTRVVFILLDFLERWTREWLWQKGLTERQNSEYKKINEFLQQFSKMQLARCNFYCGEYPRALMYFEDYISEHPDQTKGSLSFLAELYARLDEPDGVAGVMAIQQDEPTAEERILALEVSGKLADAAACYERATEQLKLDHLKGLVRCYLDLDNVNTALNFVQGVLKNDPEYDDALWELQAEPLWRLGRYDDLQELVHRPELSDNTSWGVQVGRALLSFRSRQTVMFQAVIQEMRYRQVEALGGATLEEGAYQHGYGYISRLHVLNEMQRIEKMTSELLKAGNGDAVEGLVKQLVSEWELRLKVVQESVKITEPILCLRRVMLNESKELIKNVSPTAVPLIDSLLGESWLTSAKTARNASLHQQAYTYTLKAEEYAPPTLFLEKAKLHWLREEHEHALTVLRRGLEKIIPESTSGSSTSTSTSDYVNRLTLKQRKICAEAKLLIASYNDTISNVDANTNIQHYKSAVETFREWEKSLVHLAQYYDKVFNSLAEDDRDAKGSEMQIHMINCFGKSLQYGSTYVYQSMPRLLSIWFDYGTRLLDVGSPSIREDRKNNLLKMTRLVDSFLERLPAYIFLTAFSQLVSRICHPQKEVYVELKAIIIKLLLHYPQQTLWMIISVVKSSYDVRAKRCSEIFSDSRLRTPEMSRLIRDFTGLAEKLMELCNKQIGDDVNTASVSSLLRSLPRMLAKSDFSEIMIPVHKFRKLVLPNPDFKSSQHNPFPNHYVHIVGIEDEMTILASLQRPRKITLKGSDGKKYIQMLKPKDDLRKDFRLMEFNDIVNQLLSREAEARQRRLNIRLYSVAPLNEECGLIEWVPNLVGLRPVLMTIYKQKGINMKGRELKELCCNLRDPLVKKREIFLQKLLPRHPPVLGEWFRRTFPDAQTWLTARTAYTRTAAVMSMVGYILGLGDRHGENISLDSTCGDVVHVDFNCLFNKGETFEWPERVPFRLTQNMVAAMGPLGVEGVFRRSCAVTLRVLRNNTNTLMSIVTPFVYDPLVSWPRNAPATSSAQSAERTNEQAVEHVKNIELRLQGVMKARSRSFSIPLSVDGQVNNLIKEAMSVDNLCQMYIGWGPYL